MLNARRSALLRALKKPLLLLSLIGVPVSAAGLVSGCGGGGTTGGATCFDYTTFQADTAVKFSTDVLPIFQTSCGLSMSCHGSETLGVGTAQHFLGPDKSTTASMMQIAEIFSQSVGVPSVDNPTMQVINPGHPESSFLMYKLDDDLECATLACASKMTCLGIMPQGNAMPLPEATRNIIRSWIKNGAMNN